MEYKRHMMVNGVECYGIIYRIRNKINNKCYIGQTTRQNGFNGRYCAKGEGIERVYNYYNKNYNIANTHLYSSINKYGFDCFEVDEVFDIAHSEKELNALEKMYVRIYNCTDYRYGYNMRDGGDNYNLNDITKAKISFANGFPIYCDTNNKSYTSASEVEKEFGLKKGRIVNGLRLYKSYRLQINGEIYVFSRLFDRYKYDKPIINLCDGKIFKNISESARFYGISNKFIKYNIGKHKDNYCFEYAFRLYQNIDSKSKHIKEINNLSFNKSVSCITTNKCLKIQK